MQHHFKKHKLKTRQQQLADEGLKYCPCCSEIKSIDEFYQRRGKKGGSTYCKSCTNAESSARQVNFKQKMLTTKAELARYGYDKCIGALEFTIDSSKKDFQISKVKSNSFSDRVKKELDNACFYAEIAMRNSLQPS